MILVYSFPFSRYYPLSDFGILVPIVSSDWEVFSPLLFSEKDCVELVLNLLWTFLRFFQWDHLSLEISFWGVFFKLQLCTRPLLRPPWPEGAGMPPCGNVSLFLPSVVCTGSSDFPHYASSETNPLEAGHTLLLHQELGEKFWFPVQPLVAWLGVRPQLFLGCLLE